MTKGSTVEVVVDDIAAYADYALCPLVIDGLVVAVLGTLPFYGTQSRRAVNRGLVVMTAYRTHLLQYGNFLYFLSPGSYSKGRREQECYKSDVFHCFLHF